MQTVVKQNLTLYEGATNSKTFIWAPDSVPTDLTGVTIIGSINYDYRKPQLFDLHLGVGGYLAIDADQAANPGVYYMSIPDTAIQDLCLSGKVVHGRYEILVQMGILGMFTHMIGRIKIIPSVTENWP